ncbi:hypothetical protein [Halorubrum halodurans]|uniref:Uncharacterized protein n=1 Tax=Halorubrum halodurans TaxID=1383851 RepID=A0A256IEF9_9EURY|nr:hypothetical protein [Halorubrum halodurans]OYR54904.1 hypothetical protein DJ70_12810 [Halorubrum halodurans]
MILPAQKTAASVAISRYGEDALILRPVDDDSAVDGYGKTAEDSWEEEAVEPVVRVYQRGAAPSQGRVTGGRYLTESPVLIFIADSLVSEGFRVSYGTSVYEIDSLTRYPTHIEAETTSVG